MSFQHRSLFAAIHPLSHSNTLSFLGNHIYAMSKENEGGAGMDGVWLAALYKPIQGSGESQVLNFCLSESRGGWRPDT